MPAVILDACGTINLYATGRFVPLLGALGHDWYLPAATRREAKYIRQPDPDDPTRLVPAEIDLQPALDAGILRICDCQDDAELQLYVELAARIRDDGESMGLAIAKCRGWQIVTDDRKARRIAGELGVAVLSTPEIMKAWALVASATDPEVAQVLRNIQTFACFTPNPTLPEFGWWVTAIGVPPD
jgi:predicted nucleic acid-binding protein